MWLLVFFDLPVSTPEQRRSATQFRQFLLKDGYVMLQFSVYARICKGQEAVEKHLRRSQAQTPTKGSIRALQVTDKQYARMRILLGNLTPEERCQGAQLLLF